MKSLQRDTIRHKVLILIGYFVKARQNVPDENTIPWPCMNGAMNV